MITSVELMDFLSHSNTKLELGEGVTVFIGQNGAGKSSIIDAITFSLFGKHTRGLNKGLIRRGSTQGFASVTFSANGKQYKAERKIDAKGSPAAQFSEERSGEWIQTAAGERRQFKESVTKRVEETIGMDFTKLKIASIVRQGELDAIIKADPREFKELLNAVIDIDRLDVASGLMNEAKSGFRRAIQEKYGYDDTHIQILQVELDKANSDLAESRPMLEKLNRGRKTTEIELEKIKERLDAEVPKIDKIRQADERESELRRYVEDRVRELKQDIAKAEAKIKDCEESFQALAGMEDLESEIKDADESIERARTDSQDLTGKKASLREKLELAAKLQLKDGKCPVCDSNVDRLNPLFQEEHLRKEISGIDNKLFELDKERRSHSTRKQELSKRMQEYTDAKAVLRAHSVGAKEELDEIRRETAAMRESMPADTSDLGRISQIDQHAREIFEAVERLRQETTGFDKTEIDRLRRSSDEKRRELSEADQQRGAVMQRITNSEDTIKNAGDVIGSLEIVGEYIKEVELIQERIFNREGAVATGLRFWAMNTISAKASEYLVRLNTKIQRIQITEEKRSVSIMCYAKTETLDLKSLSGGERVAVALALRLGMAGILGERPNLNMTILDEPTTHLDEERRRALVGVLSGLSNAQDSANPMQFIIISHDEAIFNDSKVDTVYRFKAGPDGTEVERI